MTPFRETAWAKTNWWLPTVLLGLEMDDPIWNPTVFTKNRERLLAGDVAHAFFDRMVTHARERGLLSTSTSPSTPRWSRRGPA